MRSVWERASQATLKTTKEKILQDHGLHDIKVRRHQQQKSCFVATQDSTTFYGTFGSLIPMQPLHMTHYILMTLENGGSIYGSSFSRLWRIERV
jgi:hypothetical protein